MWDPCDTCHAFGIGAVNRMNDSEPEDRIAETSFEQERRIEVLLRLAARAKLFRAADGRLHARVPVGNRHEIYGLRSAAFRDWLIEGYFADQNEPASDWAIRRVVGVLEARARFDGGAPSFFIRVGRDADGDGHGDRSAYFLDLGDPSGMAVKISADGWNLVDQPRVQFRRPEGHEQFLSTYNDNRKEAARTELEESSLGCVMLAFAAGGGTFSGSPSDRYASLTRGIGPKGSALARWPKTISIFSSELRRIAPQLLVHGLSIEFSRNSDRRVVTVQSAGRPKNPSPGGGPNT
jgi:hypothetical protein